MLGKCIVLFIALTFHVASAQPPKERVTPTTPDRYGRAHEGDFADAKTLADINAWISARATRLATEAHNKQRAESEARNPTPPGMGRCGGVISIMVTRPLLTEAQWRIVAEKTVEAFRTPEAVIPDDIFQAISTLQQVSLVSADEPSLLTDNEKRDILVGVAKAAGSADAKLRAQATRWLGSDLFQSTSVEERIKPILVSLKDADAGVRLQAMHALSELLLVCRYDNANPAGSQSDAVVAALREFIEAGEKSGDEKTSLRAISTLGMLGEASVTLLPELLAYLQSEDPRKSGMAAMAIEKMGPRASAIAPDLLALLDSPNERLVQRAARLLGTVGESAVIAVPRLIELLDDPREFISTYAARTLFYLGPLAIQALPKLEAAVAADPSAFGGFGIEACERIKGGELAPGYRRAWEE